jgi:hypothetical protein
LQQHAQQDVDSAVWRITDGRGAPPEVAATTPSSNRLAAGRLDFVLQVQADPVHDMSLVITCLGPFDMRQQQVDVTCILPQGREMNLHCNT